MLIRVNKYVQEIVNSITNKLFNGIQKQVKQFIRITLLRGNKIKNKTKSLSEQFQYQIANLQEKVKHTNIYYNFLRIQKTQQLINSDKYIKMKEK